MMQPATPLSHLLSVFVLLCGFRFSVLSLGVLNLLFCVQQPPSSPPCPPVPGPGTSPPNCFGLDLSPCPIYPSPLLGHQLQAPDFCPPTPSLSGTALPIFIQCCSFTKVLREYLGLFDLHSHLEKKVRYDYPLLAKEKEKVKRAGIRSGP